MTEFGGFGDGDCHMDGGVGIVFLGLPQVIVIDYLWIYNFFKCCLLNSNILEMS